ncbi:MAG: isochorismatase family protein [Sedimentisphaerales bacterium]|nr:isochorismatase family protein [Sedimentisphaerales bacterium]
MKKKNNYKKDKLIFWDVDTQRDFMKPQGTLYVSGAEAIIDKVSEVRKFALHNGYSIIADMDWHNPGNEEISESPDFNKTFPPHCMADSPGSERIGYLGDIPIEYIEINKMPADKLKKLVEKEQFHVVIRKESINAFDNPNTDRLMKLVKASTVAVFGVALDFCVKYVIEGLARHNGIKRILLRDVVKGLDPKAEEDIINNMKQTGVEITEFAELKRQLQCG